MYQREKACASSSELQSGFRKSSTTEQLYVSLLRKSWWCADTCLNIIAPDGTHACPIWSTQNAEPRHARDLSAPKSNCLLFIMLLSLADATLRPQYSPSLLSSLLSSLLCQLRLVIGPRVLCSKHRTFLADNCP